MRADLDPAVPDARAASRLAYVLFAVAFGTNVPTPLLLAYRALLDLPDTTVTAVFGVYAAGLVPALLVAGPLSDRLGRRPVTAPFVLLSAVASLVFLPAANGVVLLYAGRFLQGVVSGVVFSVGSAWLAELSGDPGAAARRAGVALSAGWSLGPLSAGLIGEAFGGTAGGLGVVVLPYLVHLAVMAPGLWVLRQLPETRVRVREPRPLLNLGVPPAAQRPFWCFVAPAAVCVFTFPSLSVTVLPLLLEGDIVGIEVAVTGVVAGLTLFTGVLVQRPASRGAPARVAPAGVLAGAVGLGVALVAAATGWWLLLLPVAVLLGAGYGLCLGAGLVATERLADPEERGALTATFYGCAYLGFAAPYLVSLLAGERGFVGPLAVLAVVALLLAAVLRRGPGRGALGVAARRG